MNRDDIIRMAREAGFQDYLTMVWISQMGRFAALVAAHEREACAKVTTTTELEHQPAGHQKPTTIVVNGRQKEVAAKELSFVDVVRLPFEDAVYTVTYKRGHGSKPEGTLVEGDTVKVKEGMIFNVARTDKS